MHSGLARTQPAIIATEESRLRAHKILDISFVKHAGRERQRDTTWHPSDLFKHRERDRIVGIISSKRACACHVCDKPLQPLPLFPSSYSLSPHETEMSSESDTHRFSHLDLIVNVLRTRKIDT